MISLEELNNLYIFKCYSKIPRIFKILIFIVLSALILIILNINISSTVLHEEKKKLNIMDFVKEHIASFNLTEEIEECSIDDINFYIFYSKYLTKQKPCVFRKANNIWPAIKNWRSESYLLSKLAKKKIFVEIKKDKSFAYYLDGFQKEEMLYEDFLLKYKRTDGPYNYYWAEGEYPEELNDDIIEPEFSKFMELDSINIWQGYSGTISLAHTDDRENFLCQVIGTKELIIAPPFYRPNVYAKSNSDIPHNYSPVDFYDPDYIKYPLFKDVKTYKIILEPGDFLYMPSFWWHHVKSSKKQNMAVNFWYTTHSVFANAMYKAVEEGYID